MENWNRVVWTCVVHDDHEPAGAVPFRLTWINFCAKSKDSGFFGVSEIGARGREEIVARAESPVGYRRHTRLARDSSGSPVDCGRKDEKRSRFPRDKFSQTLVPQLDRLIASPSEIIDEHNRVFRPEILLEQVCPVTEELVEFRPRQLVGSTKGRQHRVPALTWFRGETDESPSAFPGASSPRPTRYA
jgi:hypothetical protein